MGLPRRMLPHPPRNGDFPEIVTETTYHLPKARKGLRNGGVYNGCFFAYCKKLDEKILCSNCPMDMLIPILKVLIFTGFLKV